MHHTHGSLRGMLLAASLPAAVAAILLVALVRTRPSRVVVEGASMVPTLAPGDRLVVRRHRRPLVGDLVALRDPRLPSRLLVKRVHAVGAAGLDVRGDNPSESTDSRTFGPVDPSTVTGKVVYRYHPPARVGRIRADGDARS